MKCLRNFKGPLLVFRVFKKPYPPYSFGFVAMFFFSPHSACTGKKLCIVIDNGTVVPRFRSRSSQNDHLKAGHLYCAEGEDFICLLGCILRVEAVAVGAISLLGARLIVAKADML